MKTLVLGGARSGKSAYAESCARDVSERKGSQALVSSQSLIYIATGSAGDEEMAARIRHHQAARDDDWFLIEEPMDLAGALEKLNDKKYTIVIDCLTLWLTNCLCAGQLAQHKNNFLEILSDHQADIFIVSNEVGSGIVPLGELSREFVDQSGWLNQELARLCERVNLVVAGLPLSLKGE